MTFDGFAGAALSDSKRPGKIVADGYLAYLPDDGDLIVLPHPVESLTLEGVGASWNEAMRHGQILRFTNLVCIDCGYFGKTAEINAGGFGCSIALSAGVTAIALNLLLFDFPSWIEFSLVFICFAFPTLIAEWYLRKKHHHKAIPFQLDRCENCGGSNLKALGASTKRSLPCIQCGEQSVCISIAGKS